MPDLGTSFAFRHIQYIYRYENRKKTVKKPQKIKKDLNKH